MIGFLLLLVVFGAAMTAEMRETVPARIAGEWVADLKQCGTDRGDSRPQLDADHIRFGKSVSPIRAVVARGEMELAEVPAWNRPARVINSIGFNAF